MNGLLRYGNGIAASLLVASIGLLGRYGGGFLFPHVDPLPGPDVTFLNQRPAEPPLRKVEGADVRWKVLTVTNRPQYSGEVRTQASQPNRKPLSEQVADAIYSTAQNRYLLSEIAVPIARKRGDCPIDQTQTRGKDFVRVTDQAEVNRATFYKVVEQLRGQTKSQDVMVLVHGFNVTLDHAVLRAAQVAEDMPFDGLVIVYSWNSQGQVTAYRQDEQTAERNFWGLAELLYDLREHLLSDCRIHLLAHSMGNRVTLRSLAALSGSIDPVGQPTDMFVSARLKQGGSSASAFRTGDSSRSGVYLPSHEIPGRFPRWAAWRDGNIATPPLANLILASPDVGVAEFRRLVTSTRHLSRRITVYASDTDLALEASAEVHNERYRAGDSRADLGLSDVHVVRVSAPAVNDLLGHSYYGSVPTVLDQLHRLTMQADRRVIEFP